MSEYITERGHLPSFSELRALVWLAVAELFWYSLRKIIYYKPDRYQTFPNNCEHLLTKYDGIVLSFLT